MYKYMARNLPRVKAIARKQRHSCAGLPIASCMCKRRSRYPQIARQDVTACLTANKVPRQCNCSPQLSPAYSALEDDGGG